MAATVGLEFRQLGEPSIRVPPHAVTEDDSGRFVFVLEDAEGGLATLVRRSVSVGELSPAGLTITDGLDEGDRIVTVGVRRLQEGLSVRPQLAGQ